MFSSLCSDCRKALKAASPPARERGAVTRGARAPGSDEANGSQEPGGFPRLCIPRSFVGFLGDVSLNHVRRLLGPGPARAGTSLARRRFVSEMPLQASNAKGLGRSRQGRPRRKPRHPLLCGERRCCPRSLREPRHARQQGGRGVTASPPPGPAPSPGAGGRLTLVADEVFQRFGPSFDFLLAHPTTSWRENASNAALHGAARAQSCPSPWVARRAGGQGQPRMGRLQGACDVRTEPPGHIHVTGRNALP